MATVAFAAAAGAAAYGVGGGTLAIQIGIAAGAAAGGLIDSFYVMPTIFSKPDTMPGRITEFGLGSQTEGAPINYCLGPNYRVPGTVIWVSDVRETPVRASGGKGGSNSVTTGYTYECDVAVAACEGEISKFNTILTDGKLLYEDIEAFDETSTLLSCVRLKINEPILIGTSSLSADYAYYYQEISATSSGPDLTDLKSGESVTISGFANAGNNGVRVVSSTRTNPDGSTTARLLNNGAVNEAAGASVRLQQARKKWDANRMEDITFYTGSETQNADTLMQSHLGAANVPAYRGLAYVVIKALRLGPYGNRVPQFAFVVEADVTLTNAQAIGKIIERHGLSSSDYDATQVTGNLRGYGISGPYSAVQILDPIMIANDLWAQESGGKLHIFPRGAYSPISVDADDVAAHAEGDEMPPRGVLRDIDPYKVPTQVYVQYIDPESDYQRGSQNDRRIVSIHQSDQRVDLPLVLESGEAKAIASRILWNSWAGKRRISLVLPPKYLELRESDLFTITLWSETYTVLITDITRGASGLIELEGVVTDVQSYNEVTTPPLDYAQTFDSPSILDLRLIDIPPIRKQDVDVPGYYYGVANEDAAVEWKGAAIYDGDTETEMEQFDHVNVPTTMGFTGTAAGIDEQVVDDADPDASAVEGKWIERIHPDAYGGKYQIAQELGARFVWLFYNLVDGATYRAYVRFPVLPSGSNSVEFAVGQGFLSTGVIRNISQIDPMSANRWLTVADVTLSSNTFGFIRMKSNNNIPTVVADAAKLVRIDNSRTLADGPVGYWDRESTLTVTLESGTLESRTEREVLSGANHAMVGGEVIAFQNATLVSNNRYTLDTLLRGLRDTERATDTHFGTERFTLLDPATLRFRQQDLSDIGKPLYVKAVAPGELEDNIDPFRFSLVGATCRAMSPAQIKGERYATTDGEVGIRFTWVYRTRDIVRIFDSTPWGLPLLDTGFYQIEIRNPKNELVRTVNVSGNNFTYSNVQQLVDGFQTTNTIIFRVRGATDQTGYGSFGEISITSTL